MTQLDGRIVDLEQENAELRRQLAEALDQQTATSEVLGVINSSPGDLAPVFGAMLDKAMRLCEAAFGILFTLEGESAVVRALHNVPAEFSEYLAREPPRAGPGTLLGRAIVERVPLQAADILSSEPYRQRASLSVASAELAHVRTLLVVPLVKDDVVLGLFTVYRTEVRPFADKQIALLENFDVQAVIAMENARLVTETREALEQQTATAEVLGVINSSPGDLAPVFDALLEKAVRLCDTAFGNLMIWDGECFQRVAFRGVPVDLIETMREPMRPVPGSFADLLLKGENIVCHADLQEAEAGRTGPGAAALIRFGVRARAMVALRKDERLLGAISVYRFEARPFSDKQIALLQNFAAQAVIAIENARLITETREALDQQTATAEVLGVINSSPGDLAPVFEVMLDKALRLCGADLGNLLTYDGDRFEAVAGVYGVDWIGERELSRAPFRPIPGGLLDRLVAGGDFVHTEDVRADIAYQRSPDFRELVDVGCYHSMAHVALRKDNRLLGAIVIFFKGRRTLTDKQIALLQNFAAQAVIAMENARLITETREALEQQTATAEVLQVINASPGDLAPVFDAILEKARSLCGAAVGTPMARDGALFRALSLHQVPEGSRPHCGRASNLTQTVRSAAWCAVKR
jgi:GAF domain-containing protein